jgi:hypothetical protein
MFVVIFCEVNLLNGNIANTMFRVPNMQLALAYQASTYLLSRLWMMSVWSSMPFGEGKGEINDDGGRGGGRGGGGRERWGWWTGSQERDKR